MSGVKVSKLTEFDFFATISHAPKPPKTSHKKRHRLDDPRSQKKKKSRKDRRASDANTNKSRPPVFQPQLQPNPRLPAKLATPTQEVPPSIRAVPPPRSTSPISISSSESTNTVTVKSGQDRTSSQESIHTHNVLELVPDVILGAFEIETSPPQPDQVNSSISETSRNSSRDDSVVPAQISNPNTPIPPDEQTPAQIPIQHGSTSKEARVPDKTSQSSTDPEQPTDHTHPHYRPHPYLYEPLPLSPIPIYTTIDQNTSPPPAVAHSPQEIRPYRRRLRSSGSNTHESKAERLNAIQLENTSNSGNLISKTSPETCSQKSNSSNFSAESRPLDPRWRKTSSRKSSKSVLSDDLDTRVSSPFSRKSSKSSMDENSSMISDAKSPQSSILESCRSFLENSPLLENSLSRENSMSLENSPSMENSPSLENLPILESPHSPEKPPSPKNSRVATNQPKNTPSNQTSPSRNTRQARRSAERRRRKSAAENESPERVFTRLRSRLKSGGSPEVARKQEPSKSESDNEAALDLTRIEESQTRLQSPELSDEELIESVTCSDNYGIFKKVYEKMMDVCDISMLNRAQSWSSLVYGEITHDLVSKMIATLKSKHGVKFDKNDTFLDLGSGIGQIALQVAATTECKRSFGIEIEPYRCLIAEKFHKELRFTLKKVAARTDQESQESSDISLQSSDPDFSAKSSNSSSNVKQRNAKADCRQAGPVRSRRLGKVRLFEQDFLKSKGLKLIRKSNIIFTNNFIFGAKLNHALVEIFKNPDYCPHGTIIVSSKKLANGAPINHRNRDSFDAICDVVELCQGHVSWTDKMQSLHLHRINYEKLHNYLARNKS